MTAWQMVQVLLARASKDYPADHPPPLRFIRSCSSSLAAATLHKLEEAFKVPVLEVGICLLRPLFPLHPPLPSLLPLVNLSAHATDFEKTTSCSLLEGITLVHEHPVSHQDPSSPPGP